MSSVSLLNTSPPQSNGLVINNITTIYVYIFPLLACNYYYYGAASEIWFRLIVSIPLRTRPEPRPRRPSRGLLCLEWACVFCEAEQLEELGDLRFCAIP